MRRVAVAVCLPLLVAVLFGSWNTINPNTPDEMFFDEQGDSALSLLQKSAKKHIEKDGKIIVAEKQPELEFLCEDQCAGTLCPDPTIGMNQQISCMQACMFRLAGEGAAECGFRCDRNGGSGCSLTVNGYTANMCAYCSDWPTSNQTLKTAFVSNQDCLQGCNVPLPPPMMAEAPTTTTTTMSICDQQCAGTVCPDATIGMNQQISCAQACEFRLAGEGPTECGFKCNRNGGSGCALSVDGFTANMCAYCSDWPKSTQEQKQSFWSNQDCILGCSVALPMGNSTMMGPLM